MVICLPFYLGANCKFITAVLYTQIIFFYNPRPGQGFALDSLLPNLSSLKHPQ
jgi:hypothetical protein